MVALVDNLKYCYANLEMRFFLLLLFALAVPLVILMTTLLYTDGLNTTLKQELANTKIYDKIPDFLGEGGSEDAGSQQFDAIIKSVITPQYAQTKVETTIDDSYAWITNKSVTPPVISFKEIKTAIMEQNPSLLTDIDVFVQEAKEQSAPESPDSQEMQKSIDSLASLARSDFSVKIDKQLNGMKNFYDFTRIAQPALIGLMLLELFLIVKLSKSWKSRFKWLGATFLTAGIWGFSGIILSDMAVKTVVGLTSGSSDTLVKIFSPVVLQVIKLFAASYTKLQQSVNIGLIVAAIIFFGVAIFTKNPPATSSAKVIKKK